MFEVLPIPAFRDNYIWLLRASSGSRQAVVVDPGDAGPVLEFLDAHAMQLAAILVTHHHADHQGGVAELVMRFPAVRVFGPGAESITGCTDPLCGGESIVPPGIDQPLAVFAVPGHTRGHLAYYGAGSLFCGDTLFGAGCGRLFEGSPEQMAASLAQLASLPPETRIYCAHEYTAANLRFAQAVEPENADITARIVATGQQRQAGMPSVPSTLALELRTNPFLRSHVPAVVAAAAHAEPEQAAAAGPFAALRAWKDRF